MNTSISKLAEQIGISQGFLSNIICGRRKPRWSTAKKLGKATNTSPALWLEGSSKEIKSALGLERSNHNSLYHKPEHDMKRVRNA